MAEMTPLYDLEKTYLENSEQGPFFTSHLPERIFPPKNEWIDFLGLRLASPIGVPAGPLLNSRWIELAGRLGYDIVTYKTIRSHQYPAYPLPNIVGIEPFGQFYPERPPNQIFEIDQSCHMFDQIYSNSDKNCSKSDQITEIAKDKTIGISHSFGYPSRSPDYLRIDIPKALASLKEGQVMIVSICGTEHDRVSLIDDFAQTAWFAASCGAKLIEANYSGLVMGKESESVLESESVFKISKKIVQSIPNVPLIIKVGLFPDRSLMRETFIAAARAGVRAICGIDSIRMQVVDRQGLPTFGPTRLISGVSGDPIREAALQFIREAREIIDTEKLDLELMGTGGVTQPEHFSEFLNAGANVAMTATGMMWNPKLAQEYHANYVQVGR